MVDMFNRTNSVICGSTTAWTISDAGVVNVSQILLHYEQLTSLPLEEFSVSFFKVSSESSGFCLGSSCEFSSTFFASPSILPVVSAWAGVMIVVDKWISGSLLGLDTVVVAPEDSTSFISLPPRRLAEYMAAKNVQITPKIDRKSVV